MLSDNEIVKALECCSVPLPHFKCNECPAWVNSHCTLKSEDLINLINRLQEEKEALINGQETLQKYIADLQARIGIYETCNARKDEAIKHLESEVKRLQAENERLKSKLEPQGFEEADPMDFCGVLCDFAEGLIEKSKAEAYKEFTERLKEQKYQFSDWSHGEHPFVVEESDIDNTLYELVGEDK